MFNPEPHLALLSNLQRRRKTLSAPIHISDFCAQICADFSKISRALELKWVAPNTVTELA
jgi:hypothetical protein